MKMYLYNTKFFLILFFIKDSLSLSASSFFCVRIFCIFIYVYLLPTYTPNVSTSIFRISLMCTKKKLGAICLRTKEFEISTSCASIYINVVWIFTHQEFKKLKKNRLSKFSFYQGHSTLHFDASVDIL